MVSQTRDDRINELLTLVARAAESRDVEAVLDLTAVLQRWHARRRDRRPESWEVNDDERKNGRAIRALDGERPPSKKRSNRGEAREWGSNTKQTYASRHNLIRVSASAYQSPRGSTVGIAASRWRHREPTCFLGLSENPPAGAWDIVVLLCEVEGRSLDFVVPMERIRMAWPLLSRHGGQVKFHVQRSPGQPGQYEMRVPGSTPVDLQQFFAGTAVF